MCSGNGSGAPALRGTRKPPAEEWEEWEVERLHQERAAQEALFIKTEYTGFKKLIPFPIIFVLKAQFNKRERSQNTMSQGSVLQLFKKNNLKISAHQKEAEVLGFSPPHWKATLIRREKKNF